MKPVACGNQVYSTGTLSSAATSSAILFSNPSLRSFENGMLAGSAQTRSAVRLTRSIRCPSAAEAGAPSAALNSTASTAAVRSLLTEARFLVLLCSGRLVAPLGRTPARQNAVRARLQVDVDVVDVAHHVAIIAERRHLALFVGTDHFAAAGNHQHEFVMVHGLQRFDQARCIGRALAVRPMTHMAFGMVSAESGKRVPVNRTVAGDVIGRVAVSRLPLAVLLLLRRLA